METAKDLDHDGIGRSLTRVEVAQFIEGYAVPSASENILELCNPATGTKSIVMPVGYEADVERAVESSRTAFEDGRWCDFPASRRRSILHQFAELIETHANELDVLDAMDMGKPVSLSLGNAASSADLVRYYTQAMDNLVSDVYQSSKNSFIAQQCVPRGVVAAITPWNFPVMAAVTKIAPALAAGNSVVLKPSECSPRSSMKLAYLATEAGIPPGVLNLVQGKGETVGRALALHNDVDMLAFTGSTAVGKLMLQYAGQSNLKPVHAECGGKSPQIVFSDYENLDNVADHVAQLILMNQGQLCVTGSRLLVQKEIEDTLIEKVAERLKRVVAGDPLNPEITFGPLANQRQMERVLGYISAGKESGADLVLGGNPMLQESGGFFVEPTLFTNVPPDATIAQEEIFGPVLSVTSFRHTEEAIRLANATPFGLATYVWTTNLTTGMRLSKAIRSGMVTINASTPMGEGSAALSLEPYGLSGVGVEHGLAGLHTYLRRQVAWFNYGAT